MSTIKLAEVFNRHKIQGHEDKGIVTAVYADGGFQFSKSEVVELADMKVEYLGYTYILVTRAAANLMKGVSSTEIVPDGTHYKWCCLETGAEKELQAFIANP